MAFRRTQVVQYVNFRPCEWNDERGYMSRSFAFAAERGIGLPTLTYTDPQTGRRFAREEFVAFARDYLGVDIIFWSVSSPWLAK